METYRNDFPFFGAHPSLAYLDSATTSQKPFSVIRAMNDFYAYENASLYRGMYGLAEKATQRYEDIRTHCAQFIGAQPQEILFTKGATESINLVAHAWGIGHIGVGDEIVISEIEHHANILPWQQLARTRGAHLRWLAYDPIGLLALDKLDDVITARTRLVAVSAYSNVVGGFPQGYQEALSRIIERAHAVGSRVMVDAAQLMPHKHVDVAKLGCDFMVFSGHKMLGPQGVGVLYSKRELHNELEPYQLGGGMVADVGYEQARWRPFPYLFEAGTQAVAQVIGFGAALAYLRDRVDFDKLYEHEAALCQHLLDGLASIPRVHLLRPRYPGQADHLVSFIVEGMHPHDVAAYLDAHNIYVRAGNQCAQVLHKRLGLAGSVRASFYLYTTHQEIDKVLQALAAL